MRTLKIAGVVMGAFLILALPASAATRFRGGFTAGPTFGFGGWYGPFFGPFVPYGPYPVAYSNAGEVKLSTNVKDADVFINGAFAGKASKLKSMWLPPSEYSLEIRAAGYAPFAERIYVVPGKTIRVQADLITAPKS